MSGGEKNPKEAVSEQYIDKGERKYYADQKAKSEKIHMNLYNKTMDKGKKIKINGKVYSSIKVAAYAEGVSENSVGKIYKELQKSKLSTLTKTLMVKREFTFEKVK